MEKEVLRDVEDSIRTADANALTINNLFRSFMELRVNLKETTRCSYRTIYEKHVRHNIGNRKRKAVKYSDIQKLYVYLVQEVKLKTSTIQKVNSILYQMFDSVARDNIVRSNPTENVLKSMKKCF